MRLAQNGYAWERLANVQARYFKTYSLTVQSLSDSMGSDPSLQYFMVSAHTDAQYVYFDSPIDSGYSVDNFAPCTPLCLAGERSYEPEGLRLTWNPNTETDLYGYNDR